MITEGNTGTNMDASRQEFELSIINRLRSLKADTDAEFMKEFFETAPKEMDDNCTKLFHSIRTGNDAETVFYAHKLKGLLLTIGANDASAVCQQIETEASAGSQTNLQLLSALLETQIRDVRRILDHSARILLNEQ